jgi:prophage regulatory protein
MRFIRPGEVVRMLGVSRTTLWRMVRSGLFPRPVEITERNRGYVLEDVEAWMQARIDDGRPERSAAPTPFRGVERVLVGATAGKPASAGRGRG